MAQTDPLQILLSHNLWATRELIVACQSLDPAQFRQEFPIGLGSLQKTITHILGALRSWGDLLAGREQRLRLEQDGQDRSADELLGLLDAIATDVQFAAQSLPLDQMVTASRAGRMFHFSRAGILAHVMTHGVHHRAQGLNMLRHLGVAPLPQSSVLEWMLVTDVQN